MKKFEATFSFAHFDFITPFEMNGVSGLKPLKCHISRFTHRKDLIFSPIDAEYTILYTHLKGNKALSPLEQQLLAKQKRAIKYKNK